MKEYNQILNLTKFNLNFTRFVSNNELSSHNPDYIIEKYNHWIGFTPTVEHKTYTPDDMEVFFNKYWEIWRPDWELIDKYKFKNILMYLYSTHNHLDLARMVDSFENYIGSVNMICDEPNKKGLHTITESFLDKVLEKNTENIRVTLRDMKIKNLL